MTRTQPSCRAVRLLLASALIFAAAPAAVAQAQAPAVAAALPRVALTAGRSTVLAIDFDITRIAVTNPGVADAVVVAPREILIDGKTQGTISLIVWGDGRRVQYDVAVDAPVSELQQQLRNLFPSEDIQVTATEEAITLAGRVSSNAVMLKAGEIAERSSSKTSVINLLQVPGGIDTQQVLLQVRFAEINRTAITEAGLSLFTGVTGYKDWIGRSTTQQFAAPIFDDDKLTFSDYLNLFVFNTKYNVGGLLKALQGRGLLQSLAEPNLIAYNGKEASFLAGGEVPVPIIQGAASGGAITVQYKEFGIRLNFTPTIAGDMIRLHVKPEVSSLDFANGVTVNGFRVPALQTRRAETEIELRDGQSFAIAGLMNNITQTDKNAVPLLGSLPIIGSLFKSKAARQSKTELMVLITPRLVKPLDPDEVPDLPTDPAQFMTESGARLEGGTGTVDAPAAGRR
ncbi:MAG: type II and III secretion system protein family protein [Vicinamibacterales bacterium]